MEFRRVFDILYYQQKNFPKNDAIADKTSGTWNAFSTQQFIDEANKLSLGLLALGIQKNDKIAIISQNRTEWNFIDMAVQQLGAVTVPLYPTITVEDYAFILKDSEAKLVFVSNDEILQKVKKAISGLSSVQQVYSFNQLPDTLLWSDIKQLGKDKDPTLLQSYRDAVLETDLLTLIYTSGTTGTPKGVMLTHKNIVSNVKACIPLMPVDSTCRSLSFLPLCHVYERMLNYLYMSVGVSIYYAESLETIGDNLKEVKPHIFVTVPRLLEKVYDKIVAKGADLTGIKRALFFWALNLGLRYDHSKPQGAWYNWRLKIANKLIFNKWREALGGNVMAVVSGGAALQPRLARVFSAANIRVMEGYGLTETSPVIAVNHVELENNRVGTVGLPINGVEVKLASDGEILTRGPHIMLGYYKRPELTAEVIDADGWFHTGDIGEWYEGKFLKITDRKKEMFKTSGGKYIAPQLIENKLKESKWIEQAMVVGDGQKFPAVLLIPAFTVLKEYCEHKDVPYTSDAEMVKHPVVLEKFEREIEKANECFAQYEKIKKFDVLSQLWSIESGELTPKLSLKRKIILANNKDRIEKMYA